MPNTIAKAENFILKHARPLDYEICRFQQGRGDSEAVLNALAAYQNADGGFGGPLEPDNFCPFSLPIPSWTAITYLRKISCYDINLPLVKNLVTYFYASRRPDGYWNATDPRTKDFPHAPWWQDQGPEHRVWGFNPTAEVAGYLLRLGNASEMPFIEGLIQRYLEGPVISMHELANLLACHRDLKDLNWQHLDEFEAKLQQDLERLVSKNPEEWKAYGLRLSMFSESMDPTFLTPYQALIKAEQEYLAETQLEEGCWELNWDWGGAYSDFWPIARRWWQAIQTIKHLAFLRL